MKISEKAGKMISSAYDFWQTTYKTALSALMITLMASLMSVASVATAATTSEPASTHKDWEAHIHGKGSSKQCFITSIPKTLKGDYDRNNRDQTRVYLTHRGASRNELSTFAGYRFRDQSEVLFNIDGKIFKLYIDGSYAWAYENDVNRIVTAMKRGRKLTVTGISSRGNKTIDIYSLSGFTAAYNAINKLCPK
jgi:invasion protein IalB